MHCHLRNPPYHNYPTELYQVRDTYTITQAALWSKTGSIMMDFLTVFCSVKDVSSQLIGPQWQFPDPISENTNIMDVISPVKILAIIVT